MHTLLGEFSDAVRRQHRAGSADLCLALSVLHKRALSSARSLQLTVARRLASMLASGEDQTAHQLHLPLDDGELTPADGPPAWSPLLTLDDREYEHQLLEALHTAASAAARRETKIAALVRILRRVREPVIIFTEYRDTLLHLHQSLGTPAVVLHGGMTREERLDALTRFTSGERSVLLATDAAGEGLNLQQRCRLVINLEVPWNPMRLEQRIGRVDRIGQRRTVHVIHLIARAAGESHVLSRLQRRVARAQADIGAVDPLGIVDGPHSAAEMVAQSIIDGEASQEIAPALVERQSPHLHEDAIAEAGRIAQARAFVKTGDAIAVTRLESGGPWVAKARQRRTRARMGRDTLVLWRVGADDGGGRAVSSRLIAAMVADGYRYDDERVRAAIDLAAAEWRKDVADVHGAFARSRLLRERAILTDRKTAPDRPSGLVQRGLFERRTERAHRVASTAFAAANHDQLERLAVIERAGAISFGQPRLLLALTP